MNINTKVFKANIRYVFLGIGVLLILIGINIMAEDIEETGFVLLNNKKVDIHELVINEILTDNNGANVDENGDVYDWIELYNGTSEDIDLTNYGLSDKENGSIKWLFPEVTIKSKSYLVVYLTGKKKKGLYANFSLKNEGGETITLKSSKGKVIDTVKTLELPQNNSMYRNSDGKWLVSNEVTPGYENSTNGREEFLYSFSKSNKENTPILSEVLPSNEGNIVFNKKLYSYVEITNTTNEVLNLSDYYLSDQDNLLYKWRFPEVDLKPNESYLVFMNGLKKDNNASFDLKHKNGMILLSDKNGVVDKLEYSDLTNGVAYVKTDDEWHQSGNISPGYPNTTDGKLAFQKKYDLTKKSLLINEIMSSNSRYLVQNGNQYYDWIELYNNTDSDINLGDYTLTKDRDDIHMYQLPDKVLKPGEYYILMASGNTKLSNGNYTHANFKLSSGEGLLLYKDEKLIDSVFIYDIPKDNSYGRGKEFGHYYYTEATPGKENSNNGIREISYKPVIDTDSGVYNDVKALQVKIDGSGDIYYTLDGSTPSNTSKKYDGPINISNTSVVKAVAYEHDKKNSDVVTKSYILNENHTLPVMSVSLNKNDYNSLMYSLWSDKIVNAYVEYYEKDGSFSTNCGFKLFGGASRRLEKKSFSLEFNKKFSEEKVEYKIFDNKDIVEFGDLILRSGSQDQNSSMIRDEFISRIIIKYGTILAQDSKPVVLYINGNYWGIYYLREKINPKYIENNYNVSGPTNIIDQLFRTEDGNGQAFLELRSYIQSHNMTTDESYKYVSERMDMDAFIDYYVIQFIINGIDLHNIRFYTNPNLDNGKIKPILFDLDYAFFEDYGAGYIDFLVNHYGLTNPPDNTYIKGLLRNNQFKKRFVERVSYYMKNVWTEEHILESYNYFYNLIEPEMKRNSQRWNMSYDEWKESISNLKSRALAKIKTIPEATRKYFGLSQEEFNEYFK